MGQAEVSIGVTQIETGKITGKGKNKTFTLTSTFTQGDPVIIRAYVIDGDTGLPVGNALLNFQPLVQKTQRSRLISVIVCGDG